MVRFYPRRPAVAVALTVLVASCAQPEGGLTVFAAASLKAPVEVLAARYEQAHGVPVRVSLAGSALLARQVAAGAPADVVLLASVQWMDWLSEEGLLQTESRRSRVANRLVLISSTAQSDFQWAQLADRLGTSRLAMGFTDSVPAGVYGRQGLEALGVWPSVADRVAQSDSVRGALALVATGQARFGVVYATDAGADARVAVVAEFPASSHDAIVYPAAITRAADPDADRLLDGLTNPEALAVFQEFGFQVQ